MPKQNKYYDVPLSNASNSFKPNNPFANLSNDGENSRYSEAKK